MLWGPFVYECFLATCDSFNVGSISIPELLFWKNDYCTTSNRVPSIICGIMCMHLGLKFIFGQRASGASRGSSGFSCPAISHEWILYNSWLHSTCNFLQTFSCPMMYIVIDENKGEFFFSFDALSNSRSLSTLSRKSQECTFPH